MLRHYKHRNSCSEWFCLWVMLKPLRKKNDWIITAMCAGRHVLSQTINRPHPITNISRCDSAVWQVFPMFCSVYEILCTHCSNRLFMEQNSCSFLFIHFRKIKLNKWSRKFSIILKYLKYCHCACFVFI